jgi:hypothetical protein
MAASVAQRDPISGKVRNKRAISLNEIKHLKSSVLWPFTGGCLHADNEHKDRLAIVANSTFGRAACAKRRGGAIFA